MQRSYDAVVIGGGIVGTSAAAFLAQAGLSVALFERERLAAGASGRNSGSIQHPFDKPFALLHRSTLELYRELADAEAGFMLAAQPAGLLVVGLDPQTIRQATADFALQAPDLEPRFLAAEELKLAEPSLADGVAACLVKTGYPVAPMAATMAYARLAIAAGAELQEGAAATPLVAVGKVTGVRLASGESVTCAMVLVAAGPWSPELIPGWDSQPPIRPIWGVVVATRLPTAPHHVLEEIGVDRPDRPPAVFSLVTAAGLTSVGSTFLAARPDPDVLAGPIMARAREFVPALAGAAIESVRACARPVALDGRPLIGPVANVEGLWVCAGHGPWGISTGPGSSRLVVSQMLGLGDGRAPPEFSPARFAHDSS